MKRLQVALVCWVASLCPLVTHAQNTAYYQVNTFTTGTGIADSTGILLTNQVVDLRNQRYLTLGITFKLASAGTSDTTMAFLKSYDGTNFETGESFLWTVAANGTTTVNAVTNLDLNQAGYLKFYSITNGNSVPLTNLIVKYGRKLPRVTRAD